MYLGVCRRQHEPAEVGPQDLVGGPADLRTVPFQDRESLSEEGGRRVRVAPALLEQQILLIDVAFARGEDPLASSEAPLTRHGGRRGQRHSIEDSDGRATLPQRLPVQHLDARSLDTQLTCA